MGIFSPERVISNSGGRGSISGAIADLGRAGAAFIFEKVISGSSFANISTPSPTPPHPLLPLWAPGVGAR